MLYGLCRKSRCGSTVQLQDAKRRRFIPIPDACPQCESEAVTARPSSGFPQVVVPGSSSCRVCAAYPKAIFIQRQADAWRGTRERKSPGEQTALKTENLH